MKSEIISAKKKLSKGNVKEAIADYNRARGKGDLAAAKDSEAKQLETDLRRAQGNNLIQAQNAFSSNNYGQVSQQQQLPSNPAIQYDNAAAEAQWTKLQQAQELGVARVQPIRVNLPTRGLHHTFTQLLQTEGGKPLTIHMMATNARTPSWPKRIAGPIAGFLTLWVIVALLTNRSILARRSPLFSSSPSSL